MIENEYFNHPYVVIEDGEMKLYTSSGQLVNSNIWIRLHDSADEIPTAICKFVVKIMGSKEEMMANIVKQQSKQYKIPDSIIKPLDELKKLIETSKELK